MTLSPWADWPAFKQDKVRHKIAELAKLRNEGKATHEIIEEAILLIEPTLRRYTVEDEEYEELVSAVWREYARYDAAD